MPNSFINVAGILGYVSVNICLFILHNFFPTLIFLYIQDNGENAGSYEDRTLRFFPPAPRVPRMSGVVSGDSTLMDNIEDSFQDLLNTSHQRFNILCSADKDGGICFSIFGIFPIGKIVSNLTTFFHYIGAQFKTCRCKTSTLCSGFI